MGFQKKYLKTKPLCKVKFELPEANATDVRSVNLVGEFNDWSESATQMKKQRDGSFVVTLNLAPGCDYEFRYLLDGEVWENDPDADGYRPNQVCGADNSVVSV